jgi:hypothetical protein
MEKSGIFALTKSRGGFKMADWDDEEFEDEEDEED